MTDDNALLREFVQNGSEEAFSTLVARYVSLVHSAALRHVDYPQQAEEVTQAVFIVLGRKAARLQDVKFLSGWLFETTRLAAANFMRSEIRRRRREQEAYMQTLVHEPQSETWAQVGPILDDAVASLNARDRQAILLRFFERRSLAAVGTALGCSEDGAYQRVDRAVKKLRRFFVRRGVTLPAATLIAVISANSVLAAPASLAASAAAAGLAGGLGTASAMGLAQATIHLMTWAKVKLGIGTATVLLAAGAIAAAVISAGDPDAREILRKTQERYASLTSYSDRLEITTQTFLSASAPGGGVRSSDSLSIQLGRPNLYRVEELKRPDWLALWSTGDGNFWMMYNTNFYRTNNEQVGTELLYVVPTDIVPAAFFAKSTRNPLAELAASRDLTSGQSEPISDVDCYTIAGSARSISGPPLKMTLWIGKEDFLIHQVRTVFANPGRRIPSTNLVTQTHERISLNWAYSTADFLHEVPAGRKVFNTFPGPRDFK